MITGVPIRLADFTGGEASIFPVSRMPSKYSTLLQNCHLSEHASIEKIPGYVKVNAASSGITFSNGYQFRKSDGTEFILVSGGGSIFKVVGDTLVAIKTGLNTSARVSYATMNDLCIMVNGVDAPMKFDGTTVSALGGTPPATAFKVHVHKGRVWMLEKTDRLLASHSALNNPEDYTTASNAGYIDFKFVLTQGDELLDVKTYIDLQIFFFRNHIAIYSGTNPTSSGNYAIVQLIQGAGVVATDAAIGLGTDMAFVYDSGVKSLRQVVTTGSLNMNDLSEKIDPVLRGLIKTGTVFSVAHYPKFGWLMMLINETVFIYSYTWKAWGRMVGADVKGMFSTDDGRVFLCGTGFLYEYGSGWDFAGVAPVMEWHMAWVQLSSRGTMTHPKLATVVMHPEAITTLSLETRFDLNNAMSENLTTVDVESDNINYIDSIADWDAIAPLDEVLYTQARIPLFGKGRIMQMIFRNTSTLPVDISDIVIWAVPGGY